MGLCGDVEGHSKNGDPVIVLDLKQFLKFKVPNRVDSFVCSYIRDLTLQYRLSKLSVSSSQVMRMKSLVQIRNGKGVLNSWQNVKLVLLTQENDISSTASEMFEILINI